MADATTTLAGDATQLKFTLNAIRSDVAQATSSMQGFDPLSSVTGRIVTFTAVTTQAITGSIAIFNGLKDAILSVVSASSEIDAIAFRFKNFTDSATQAGKAAEIADKFSQTPPFGLQAAEVAIKSLLSSGTRMSSLQKELDILGNVAYAAGIPLETLAQKLRYAQEVGSVSMREISDLAEGGIPIFEALSKVTGLPMESMKDSIIKGKVGFTELKAALAELGGNGKQFGSAMGDALKTVPGALAGLMGALGELKQGFSSSMGEGLANSINDLREYMLSLEPVARKIGTTISTAFSSLAGVCVPVISGMLELVSSTEWLQLALKDLVIVFVLVKTGIAASMGQALASVKASCASMVASFAGLKHNVLMAMGTIVLGIQLVGPMGTLKIVCKAALQAVVGFFRSAAIAIKASFVAIKASLISTGIGAIVVLLGEAVSYVYDVFTSGAESEKAAVEITEEHAKAMKDLKKEFDSINNMEDHANFLGNIDEQIESAEKKLKQAKSENALNNDKKPEIAALEAQINELEQYRNEIATTGKAQVLAREAAERHRLEVKALEEAMAKATEEAKKLTAEWDAKQTEKGIQKLDLDAQVNTRLSNAGLMTELEMTQEIQRLRDKIGQEGVTDQEVSRYKDLLTLSEKIAETQDEKNKKQDLFDKDKKTYEDRITLLTAEISKDKERIEQIKKKQAIEQETLKLKAQGFQDAEERAIRLVELEAQAEEARKVAKEQEANEPSEKRTFITDSKAAVGGGGNSVVISGPVLSESKKQTAILERTHTTLEAIKNKKSQSTQLVMS